MRGDNAIDPKLLQELERLRIANADLKATLAKANDSVAVTFDPALKGPETGLTLRLKEVTHHSSQPNTNEDYTVETTFKDIFLAIYDEIVKELGESQISNAIASNVGRPIGSKPLRQSYCNRDDYVMVRRQFEALGLIELIG